MGPTGSHPKGSGDPSCCMNIPEQRRPSQALALGQNGRIITSFFCVSFRKLKPLDPRSSGLSILSNHLLSPDTPPPTWANTGLPASTSAAHETRGRPSSHKAVRQVQNTGLSSSLHLFIINDQLEPMGSVVQSIRDWTRSRKAWILALAMQQHPHRPPDPAEPQTSPVSPCLPPLHGFQTGWVRKVCVVGFRGAGIKCIQVQASRRPLSSGQVWSYVLLRDPLLLVQVSFINPK